MHSAQTGHFLGMILCLTLIDAMTFILLYASLQMIHKKQQTNTHLDTCHRAISLLQKPGVQHYCLGATGLLGNQNVAIKAAQYARGLSALLLHYTSI